MFDLVDLNTFAYAAPALRAEWGLSIGAVGAITSATGVLGGVLVATIYSGAGVVAVDVYLAIAALLLGLVMRLFAERTTNRRLEDIERG